MEKKSTFKLLVCFFAERKTYILLFSAYALIFAVVFFLYGVSAEPILYSAIICTVIAIFAFAFRFYSYCGEYRERMDLFKNIEIEYANLPSGNRLAENDYKAMLEELGRKSEILLSDYKNAQKENIEYYSAWVHQIKTPISAMQMLLQAEDTNENRQLLSELFRIEQYVNMALCYIRLDSVSTDFVFRECQADNIIRQAIHKFAPQFISRKIRLIYEPADVTVLTDEKWLLFIIEQLLSNALKYTNRGSIEITVTDDKKIRIADTGIGIATEDLPRIFEKGFTGYNGRDNTKSTGLGLYMSKKTADKISAKISAESEIGKGSCFTIDLHTDKLEIE